MSIKNDRWIREQAIKGMIEPFEPGQVRYQNDEKIVSYGTSSYGYDVRCAREFKIFTNINSTIVDPALRGQGVAAALLDAVVDEARANGMTVHPICSYARKAFFNQPDKYQEIQYKP